MNFEFQKNIFLKTINHIPNLNELLMQNNGSVDKKEVATNLDSKVLNLYTDNNNVYLSSLLIIVFSGRKDIIKIKKDDVNKMIIINFVNTVLEELNIAEIEFEVI